MPSTLGYRPPEIRAPDDEIARAAEIINTDEKVAILVGQGARGAVDEVIELAERTGGGIAKALLGKDVIPDDLSSAPAPSGCWARRRHGRCSRGATRS